MMESKESKSMYEQQLKEHKSNMERLQEVKLELQNEILESERQRTALRAAMSCGRATRRSERAPRRSWRATRRGGAHIQVNERMQVLRQELDEMATQLAAGAQEVEQRLGVLLVEGPPLERLNAVHMHKMIEQMYSTRRHAVRQLQGDLTVVIDRETPPPDWVTYPTIQPCEEVQETELPELPDDVLVHIFSFMSPRHLLRSVRRVSKKCRDLVGSPDSWRCAEVAVRTEWDVPMLAAVLRTAPFLRRLDLPNLEVVPRELVLLLASKSSAAKKMFSARRSGAASSSAADISVDVPSGCTVRAIGTLSLSLRTYTHCARALPILQHFREGGLRSLRIGGYLMDFGSDIVKVLLGMDELETLDVGLWTHDALDLGEEGDDEQNTGKRRLRRLIIRSATNMTIRKRLIHRFAPGLEEVHILGASSSAYMPTIRTSKEDAGEIAVLLAAAGLQRMTLPAIGDFSSIKNCHSVTELTLIVDGTPARFDDSSGLLSFLRDATWLKSLCIVTARTDGKTVSDMLTAVSSSGLSKLETLCLLWPEDSVPCFEAPWVTLLPGLPHLVRLHLNYMPSESVIEDLIAAPGSVPRGLRVLDTGPLHCCRWWVPVRGHRNRIRSDGCGMFALDRLARAQPNPLAAYGLCAPLGIADTAQQAQCACHRVVDNIFKDERDE